MRKLAWIAAAGAILALIVAVGFGVLGGQGAKAQTPLEMGIDPETTGNTCSPSPADCTLGPIESYYEVTCPSAECTWDGSSTFDGVSDYIIDVYIDDPAGSAPAPIAYDAWVYYDETIVNIANSSPDGGAIDTDGKIKMPGADFGSGGEELTLPDSDGKFFGGWLFIIVTPVPGTNTYIGDGPLLRLGLDIGASGLVTFSFDEVGSAYISAAGSSALTFQTAQLAINQAPEVDLSVDSVVTAAPTDLDAGQYGTLSVSTTGTNTGSPLPSTVEVTVSHTVTAPVGCEVNSAASASDSWTGDLAGGASYLLSTDFTIQCSGPGDQTFVVENEIELLEPGYSDPTPGNNTDSEYVNVEVWADSDIKIFSFDVVYDRIIDSDADTVPDLAVVDVSTPTDIIVRKVLHNNGPYGPIEVNLSKAAAVVSGNAEVLPPTDSEQAVLPVSSTVTVDETFTIHCYDSNVGQEAEFQFDNDVTVKDTYIEDWGGASDSTTFTVLCVPRFTPAFLATIDEDDGTMNPPLDDICILGLPCKTLTSVDIPADDPKQPLAVIQTAYPAALDIANGASITNGHTVGKSDFWVTLHVQGLTLGCTAPISGSAIQYDACMPNAVEPACSDTSSPYALFPGSGDCSGPGQECGFIYWPQQLDAIENFVQAYYPGAVLWARYVGTTGSPLMIPVNILVWNLGPSGWLSIAHAGDPDYDLDGLWDEATDPDDDNDGIPDDGDGSGSPRDNPCTGGATTNCDDNCPPWSAMGANPAQLDADGDGVGDACDPNPAVADPTDPQTFVCSPYHSETMILGETQNPSGQILRTCEVFGTHTVAGIPIREDTGEATLLFDTITCISTDTDLEVDLAKNEVINVPQDLVHTETVEVSVYNNGPGPTDYEVELVQLSSESDKCVSHLVPEAGDTLDEYSDGNQFYSTLMWTEPVLGAFSTHVSSRDYEIVCSQSGTFPDIEQFSVDVQALSMNETDPADNTAVNYVSVESAPDVDGDTIPNADDDCPFDQEDFDGIQDEDGCPETDADGDGILDEVDACPEDPEDLDGIQDEDGCPETDADGDGILDEVDACPEEPEDFNGIEDEDGCPETDTDSDGMPDVYEQANACLDPLVDDAAEDPDGDDLTNIDEMDAGSDPCDEDSDDDTFLDGQENSLGSDPLNVDSTPEHISLPWTCTDGIDNDLDGLPDLFDCDTDGDGIANYFDACPFTAEDMDGHQDDDGCPDTDNDMDGVCDPWAAPSQPACTGSDGCPNVVEDIDSFADTDGCPDPDNDGDGFPDYTDFCPGTDWTAGPDGIADSGDEPLTETEPPVPMQTKEDYDGVIDWDGCHDSPGDDWDSDGMSDEVEVFDAGTDPTDMDTDNDGLCDGHKLPLCASEDANNNGIVDPGETDPTDPDTDGDGLSDGLESGLTVPETPDTDTSSPNWQPDADPASITDPLNPDSDGDGIDDGAEDPDQNGRVDPGETAPDDDDTDDDEFLDAVELYLETDPTDACPDGPSDDAWPLDMDMNGVLNLTGDASLYPGEIGCNVSTRPECKRLDLDMSGVINLTGDAIKYVGRIGESCT